MNLKDCQVFTPIDTVKYMLDLIEYNEEIFGKTIIDFSCGCGNFLVETVRRFIEDGTAKNISKVKIKHALQKCIWGCDVDENCVEKCIDNLDRIAREYGLHSIKWSVSKCDGLYFDNGIRFDYVVGNPPYICYLNLDKETRQKTKENFRSCSKGKFDYSYAFIEKGLQLLKNNGIMVMISPINMFKTVFADNLRNIIKPEITKIIDCSTMKIFDEVLTSPAITVYKKGTLSNALVYKELKKSNIETERIIDKSALSGKWNFTDYTAGGKNRFGDYYKVSNCIATLANRVFIHTENQYGELGLDIEKGALKIAVSPKSEQFSIKQKIIFPYYYRNGKLKNYSEEEITKKYPKLMDFLTSKKQELLQRDSDKNAKWFEFGRSQALSHINQRKLLISTIITKKIRVYDLDASVVPYSGIYIIPRNNASLDDAKLILQTERFYNYLFSKGVKVSGDSFRISSKDIEDYKY